MEFKIRDIKNSYLKKVSWNDFNVSTSKENVSCLEILLQAPAHLYVRLFNIKLNCIRSMKFFLWDVHINKIFSLLQNNSSQGRMLVCFKVDCFCVLRSLC